MQTITNLSATGFAKLVTFCHEHLAPQYDAQTYANGLLNEVDLSCGAYFEIRGLHAASGNPATINLDAGEDLVIAEADEESGEMPR